MYRSPSANHTWLVQKMKKPALYLFWSSLIISVVFFTSVSLAKAQNGPPLVAFQTRDVQDTGEAGVMPELIGEGAVYPDQPSSNDGEVATADPGKSEDLTGDDTPEKLTMTSNKAVDSTLVSDDFDQCALDTGVWTVVDPLGDGTVALAGGKAMLSVPAGVNHVAYTTNETVRIMQATDDVDFELEVKFDSPLNEQYQMQGMLVEEDATNYLRLEFHSDASNTVLYTLSFADGGFETRVQDAIAGTGEAPQYMRVNRVGDQWTQSYSFDGQSWETGVSFVQPLEVSSAGVYAGNYGVPAPAHTAVVDYFYNTAAPGGGDVAQETLAVNEVGNGVVSKSPDQAAYLCGEVVTLTAAAGPDWVFSGWSGALSGDVNPETIIISDGTQEVTATFLETFVLTTDVVGNGQVTADPDQVRYVEGDAVTLTAVADAGWIFTGWSGDLSSQENPATIVMDKDKTITATFAKAYVLTTGVVGNGQVTADPDQEKYAEGDEVSLTAVAVTGWAFSGWSGDLSGQENPTTIVMDKDRTITAEFEQVEITLFLPIIMRP